MEVHTKSQTGPFIILRHGTAFEIVQYFKLIETFKLQLLNRRMYHVILPSIMYRVEFKTKIEIVLQNASGRQLFYYTIDKYTKKYTCELLAIIRESESVKNPRQFSFDWLCFKFVPAQNWFILD